MALVSEGITLKPGSFALTIGFVFYWVGAGFRKREPVEKAIARAPEERAAIALDLRAKMRSTKRYRTLAIFFFVLTGRQ